MAKLIFLTKNERAAVIERIEDGVSTFTIEVQVPHGRTQRQTFRDEAAAIRRAEALAG